MLIDFKYTQLAQFESVIERLRRSPKQYLDFASVADFYQATWLGDLPSSASWTVTGLDDGASILKFAWLVLSAWFLFILQMILSYRMAHIDILDRGIVGAGASSRFALFTG